jgi:hypothetical protein
MRSAIVPAAAPPSITEGARFVMRDVPGEPRLICADSVGMLQPDDAGQIAVTASHMQCFSALAFTYDRYRLAAKTMAARP